MTFTSIARVDASRAALLTCLVLPLTYGAAGSLFASTGFAKQLPVTLCPATTAAQDVIAHQQWGSAAQSLRIFVDAHPACPDARYLLGYVLLRDNQPDASLKAYSEAAKLRPPTSDDFTAVASDYILLQSYSEAQRWLLRAVATPPVNSQAWYLLGRTQYNLDLNAAAVQSFKRSLTVLPEDSRSEYNLGLAYERLQQLDFARTAYQTAIQWGENKNSKDAQPYLDLGLLIRSQGSPQEALPYLQKAAALSPNNPLVLQELGRTLSEVHRLEEAITALRTAITLAPSAEPPHFFLGRVYRAAGKTAEANEQFAIVQKLTGNESSSTTPNTDHTH